MNVLDISNKIIKEIVDENIPFAVSLRKTFKSIEISKEDRKAVTAVVGCVLRHFLVLSDLIEQNFTDLSNDDCYLLMIFVCNVLFLKRFDNKIFDEKLNNIDGYKSFKEMIIKPDYKLIGDEINNSSPEFLSYRFNTPLWIIKMWQKQYGYSITNKILKANYRRSTLTVALNDGLKDKNEILTKHPELKETNVPGLYLIDEKFSFKLPSSFDQFDFYPLKAASKYVIDSLDIDAFKGIAIYSEVPNNLYIQLLNKFGKQLELELMFEHFANMSEAKKIAKMVGANNVNAYNCSSSEIVTCLSKKVNTFFILPRCSFFDLLRNTPDYFLKIKQNDLDDITNEQRKTLKNASEQVDLYGNLIYMIPTICKKEAERLIEEFLKENTDFVLTKEQQFFPFESLDSCLYCAILTRRNIHD